MVSQEKLIIAHMQEHGDITSLEAINRYGITRLAAVVCALRKKGHRILSTDVEVKNRYGKTVTVTRYTMP